jgi:phage I-like protein
MRVFHSNSFDDIYQFLILHVRAFQQEISIDYDDQTILMKEENQWFDYILG